MWWMITRPRGGGGHSRARGGVPLWVTPGSARAPPTTASRRSTATQVSFNILISFLRLSISTKTQDILIHESRYHSWINLHHVSCRNWFLYIMQCFGPCLTKICRWSVFMVAAQAQVMICVGFWFSLNKAAVSNSIEDARALPWPQSVPGLINATRRVWLDWTLKAMPYLIIFFPKNYVRFISSTSYVDTYLYHNSHFISIVIAKFFFRFRLK